MIKAFKYYVKKSCEPTPATIFGSWTWFWAGVKYSFKQTFKRNKEGS